MNLFANIILCVYTHKIIILLPAQRAHTAYAQCAKLIKIQMHSTSTATATATSASATATAGRLRSS